MAYKLSKEQQNDERIRCAKDVEYFVTNYVYIQHPTRGFIPFTLFDFQKDALKEITTNRYNIILKSRQLGLSTLTAAYILWLILFKRSQKVVIVSAKEKSSIEVLDKVKFAYTRLPEWLSAVAKPLTIANKQLGSATALKLSNGSTVVAEATTENSARGGSLSLLVIDEAAAIDNKQVTGLWNSAYSTLSTGGKCLIISTPRGVGNFYHEMWSKAVSNENGFNPIRLHWTQHPEYTQEWYEDQCKNMTSKSQIAQELDCSFENSGETFFDSDDIKRMREFIKEFNVNEELYEKYCRVNNSIDDNGKFILRQHPEKGWIDRNYWIWERPRQEYNYVIGVDVARGDGQDFSAAIVLKVETGEVVAEYKGKTEPLDFAVLLDSMGREYDDAMIIVENNREGYTVLKELETKFEYPNLYYSYKTNYGYCSPEDALYDHGVVIGITTNVKSRPMLLAKLSEYIRNEFIVSFSERLLYEMDTFIWDGGKAGAQKNRNDDLIIALTFAIWAKDAAFNTSKKESKYAIAALGAIFKSSQYLDTRIAGMHGYESKMSKKMQEAAEKKKLHMERYKKKRYFPSIIKA